jgi:hypothetical protein
MIAVIPRCRKSARNLCAIISLMLMFCYFAVIAESVVAAEAHRTLASFKPDVDLDIEDGEFELQIDFTLGAGNNGLDLSAEPVILEVKGGKAAFSVTIPAGSFKKDRSGQFGYQGTINKVNILASIRPVRDGAFRFEIEGERVNLRGVANPVTVGLAIGDDAGSTVVKAKIE